ncbi:hypothetical protein Tco_0375541, partial [Tanacetum coccineum]
TVVEGTVEDQTVGLELFTPEVGAVSVVSPARVLDLVDYSSSFDYDTSKDSLPPAPNLPLVSPFLCSDEYEGGTVGSRPAEHRSWLSHLMLIDIKLA